MLPIRDDTPRSTTPFINYFLIGLNLAVFFFEWTMGPRSLAGFEFQFAFVPHHVEDWLTGSLPAAYAFVPFLSSMFLHASWPHVIANMWFLRIVGANGAIAGVMGAYFILYPRARVLTWWVFFVFWLPAWLVLGYWFLGQFLSGAASLFSSPTGTGGVAFWAHVGGFVTGVLLIKLLPVRKNVYAFEEY